MPPRLKMDKFDMEIIRPMCLVEEKDFRDSAPVTYARGFTGMQSRMFPAQYQQFMSILMSHFGRNPYFERRRGEFPLSPKEQRIVLNALRRVGVTEELRFDHYEESVNWYD